MPEDEIKGPPLVSVFLPDVYEMGDINKSYPLEEIVDELVSSGLTSKELAIFLEGFARATEKIAQEFSDMVLYEIKLAEEGNGS